MGFWELVVLAVGLSMDAFAVSICKGLALLNYMLDHNRHHADELHDICHALEDEGKTEAAAALAEALHAFDHGNDKLEKALELAKQA